MQNTLRVYTESEGTGVQNIIRVYTEGEGAGDICTMLRIHPECTLKVRELEVFVQCAECTQSVH